VNGAITYKALACTLFQWGCIAGIGYYLGWEVAMLLFGLHMSEVTRGDNNDNYLNAKINANRLLGQLENATEYEEEEEK